MLKDKIVDRDSQQKLYVQLATIVKERIETRDWPAGSQIPTEDELCRTFDVSKATVRMAIAELVRSGYLRKQQGKGTFVTQTLPDLGVTMKTRLTEDMFGEGVRTRKEILLKGIKDPPDDVKEHLKTGDEEIYYILCKRVVNGEAAYLEESFIPLKIVPDIESAEVCQMPLYEMIQQRAAKKIHKVVQTIEIAEMNGNAAEILKTGDRSPLLMLHRLLVGRDGSPLAYTRLIGSGRKYKLQTELVQIT
jgi:GntR family transcriptional regulator